MSNIIHHSFNSLLSLYSPMQSMLGTINPVSTSYLDIYLSKKNQLMQSLNYTQYYFDVMINIIMLTELNKIIFATAHV